MPRADTDIDNAAVVTDVGELMALCLIHGKVHPNLDANNMKGDTPLHAAVTKLSTVVAKAVVEAGARLDAHGSQGCTALHCATIKACSSKNVQADECAVVIIQGMRMGENDSHILLAS